MARTYKQTFMIFLPLWLLYLEVIQLTINDFSPFVDAACAQQNAVNECLRSATAAIKDCGMNSTCACDQLTQRLACYTQCKDDIDFYNAGLSNERPLLIQACNDAHKVIKIPDPIPAAEAAAPGAEAAVNDKPANALPKQNSSTNPASTSNSPPNDPSSPINSRSSPKWHMASKQPKLIEKSDSDYSSNQRARNSANTRMDDTYSAASSVQRAAFTAMNGLLVCCLLWTLL